MPISVKFLEAHNGDSVLIFFQCNDGNTKNILANGGTRHISIKKRIEEDLRKEVELIQKKNEKINLLILTHIDDDIGGILELFKDRKLDKTIMKNLCFNSGRLITEHIGFSVNDQDRNISLEIYNTLETSSQKAIDFEFFFKNLICLDRTIKKSLKRINNHPSNNQDKISYKFKNCNKYWIKQGKSDYVGIEINDIIFVEAKDHICEFNMIDGQVIEKRTTLTKGVFEATLALYPNFYRLSRSFIVNLQHIKNVNGKRIVYPELDKKKSIRIPDDQMKILFDLLGLKE